MKCPKDNHVCVDSACRGNAECMYPEPQRTEFKGVHLSTNGINAGKNYKLFLSFLTEFLKSGASVGEIEFTCPENQELKVAIAELERKLKVATDALEFYAKMKTENYEAEGDGTVARAALDAIRGRG